MGGVSIIMTAYNSKQTIKQAIDSVYTQSFFKDHDNWELLLGIDGCKDTLDYIQSIRSNYDEHLRVFMMDSNKGTYITSNTLLKLSSYDWILRFDSDDILLQDAIEEMYKYRNNYDACQYKMYIVDFNLCNRRLSTYFAVGHIFIKRSVLIELGGWKPWPCSADSELVKCRLAKFYNVKQIDKPLFIYRSNPTSLTHSGATKKKSDLRKHYINTWKNEVFTSKREAIIDCITNTYKEVFLDKGVEYNRSAYDIEQFLSSLYPNSIDLSKLKKVIYTVSDSPEEITNKKKGYDYICFTDNSIQSDTWKIHSIPDDLKSLSKEKQKTIIKICPHLYLSEYDFSIYTETPNEIKDITIAYNKSVYMYKYLDRGCIYNEANSCIDKELDKWSTIHNQMMRYSRNLYPVKNGLVKTDTIYRLHNSNYCKRLMNRWRTEVEEGSYIDRLSFNYCLWKVGNKGFAYV